MSEPTRSAILVLATMLALYSGVYASASLLAPKLFLKYLAIRDWSYGIRGRSSLPDSILTYPLTLIQKAKACSLLLGGSILGFYAAGAILPDQLSDALSLSVAIVAMGKVAVAMLLTLGFVGQEERVSRRVGEFNPDHLAWHRDYEKADADIRGLRDWNYDVPRQLSVEEESIVASSGALRRWTKLGEEDARKGVSRCAIPPRKDLQTFGGGWNATTCGDAYRDGWYSAARELEKSGWRNGSLEARIGASPEANEHEEAQNGEALAEARRAYALQQVRVEARAKRSSTRKAAKAQLKIDEAYRHNVATWEAHYQRICNKTKTTIVDDTEMLRKKGTTLHIENTEVANLLIDLKTICSDLILEKLYDSVVVDCTDFLDDFPQVTSLHIPFLLRRVEANGGKYLEFDALDSLRFSYTKEGIISAIFFSSVVDSIGISSNGHADNTEPVFLFFSQFMRISGITWNHVPEEALGKAALNLAAGVKVTLGRAGCLVEYGSLRGGRELLKIALYLSHKGRVRIVSEQDVSIWKPTRTLWS